MDQNRQLIKTIANATGLHVPKNGLAYPSGSVDIPNLMRPKAVGGVLEQSGMVEVVSVSTPTANRSPMTSVKACGFVSKRIPIISNIVLKNIRLLQTVPVDI